MLLERFERKKITEKEIAKELGYGVSTVTRHLLDMGIHTRIDTDKRKMIDLHNEGLSDREIADVLGCTRSNVTVYLNRNGFIGRKSKIYNLELRNRISNSLIGKYAGEDNPNYKGNCRKNQISQ